MNFVINLILAAQMLSALGMIGLILVQHGKGADMGAAFGSGGSGSLFGASGVPSSCRAPSLCWRRYFLPAPWHWPTSAAPVRWIQTEC